MRTRRLVLFLALTALICGLFSPVRVIAGKQTISLDGHVRDFSKSVSDYLSYQGHLVDSADSSAITAVLEITFRLFDSESKGAELWSEIHLAVEVNNGLFHVLLGSVTAFPNGLFDGSELWLQTEVGTEVLSPRKPLVSVAYSHRTNSAEMLEDNTLTDLDDRWVNEEDMSYLDAADGDPSEAVYVDDNGKVGIGTTSPLTELDVNGSMNATTYYGDGSNLTGVTGAPDDDWTISGDEVYHETGNVGIGTTSPSHPLDVTGAVGATTYYGDGSNLTGISGTTDNDWTIDGDNIYHIPGNVGIGTATPATKLDVSGDINTNSLYKIGGQTVVSVSGTENILVGVAAGENNAGNYATFVGDSAGYHNQGDRNTFLGQNAGYSNTIGPGNTFVGYESGLSNTEAFANTFMGSHSGLANTVGYSNTFIGESAGRNNITGWGNTFVGISAGLYQTAGNENSFFGMQAGQSNAGSYNTFIGSHAGFSNETGGSNTFVGRSAGNDNTTGLENTFLGAWAGANNISGSYNTFVGKDAGSSNTTGLYNTFVGRLAGHSNLGAYYNTFLGTGAGEFNTAGQGNTFVGHEAGRDNDTGGYNTFLGTGTGALNTTGRYNTCLGYGAGSINTVGDGNLLIGYQAGFFETGSDKLYIANGSGASDVLIYGDFSTRRLAFGTLNPDVMLHIENSGDGESAFLKIETSHPSNWHEAGIRIETPQNRWHLRMDDDLNNQIPNGALGLRSQDTGVEVMTWAENGNVGIGVSNPTYRLQLPNNANESGRGRANQWTTYSSREEKRNITALVPEDYAAVLEEIAEMDLVYYRYKNQEDDRRYLGVIAEEAPEQIATPDRTGISLSEFTAFALAGLKAQQEQIEEQQGRIDTLEEEMAVLKSQLQDR